MNPQQSQANPPVKVKWVPPKSEKPPISDLQKEIEEKKLVPEDLISPPNLEVDFDFIKIGDVYLRTLFIGGYPRFVTAGWLEPVINFNHSMDISFYIYPVEGKSVLDDLRRKIAEMEAEISTDLERGKIVNPSTTAKLEDAKVLQDQLVKGIERFFEFSFYITIPAPSLEELNHLTRQVESTLGALLIVAKRAALDMENGFASTAPFGIDRLAITRNMDTTSLATTFPFTSAELSSDEGILYGINPQNDSFIIFDRFSLENSNMTIFATSGAGKSTSYNDPVLFDNGSGPKLEKIGKLIENLMQKNKITQLDQESEGVINPNLKIFSFDKNLKTKWSDVKIAARKLSPNDMYQIITQSGREITITGDHCLVALKNGKVVTIKGKAAKIGNYLPVPRLIENLEVKNNFSQELLTLLGLITSEGHTRKEFVSIYNTDKFVLKKIEKCALKLGFYVSPISKDKKIRGYYLRPADKARILIKKFGGFGSSKEKRVPSIIFSLPNSEIAQYLKAYFEGDGGCEDHEITATTKSKNLASDLSYLLLRFGIIARIKTRKKAATNTVAKTKRKYYRVSISGQDNIKKFIDNIGFLTEEKNTKAQKLLKAGNTNVDIIPEIESIFKEIYPILYNSEIPAPQKFSEIKLGIFKPSRQNLLTVIAEIEKRIQEIKSLETDGLSTLNTLKILEAKRPPKLKPALKIINTEYGYNYTQKDITGAVYRSFQKTGESLIRFDKSLWSAITQVNQNPLYQKVLNAREFINQKYEEKKFKLKEIKEKLSWLKTLANSDLFWDPIVKIKKIKSKHKYVYDLEVDNAVFMAGHGGLFIHNSFFVKLEALRSLMLGTQIIILDPENEYKTLCEAVGGEFITFSFSSPSKINPFDLSTVYEKGESALGLKILSLHSLFKIIMGALTATQEAMLDRAIIMTYKAKGITQDPETQTKEPPLMEDLYKTLIGMEVADALDMAARIEKFVKGSFVGIFDQQTNVDIKNPFTVFSVRDLQDALRPIAMFIILDFIWTKVKKDLARRLMIVDEAWHMMRYEDSAQFLWSIVKRARKYYLGITTITQDVEDFLSQDIGKAVVTNSALRVLLKQSPAAIDRVGEIFYLSQGERQLLLAANVGEGIFFAGPHHAPIRVVASPEEYKLITTKPQELVTQSQKPKGSEFSPSEVVTVVKEFNKT